MSGLQKLADRCEQESGEDAGGAEMRTLNADILRALGWRQAEGDVIDPAGDIRFQVPYYAGSLDAAMTLIGENEFWRLGNDGEGPDPANFKATVTAGAGSSRLVFCDAVAVTPALSLTAAALRAHDALR